MSAGSVKAPAGSQPTLYHVGQARSLIENLKKKGQVAFERLEDAANGVALCQLCHAQFDNFYCPGITFFPTEIAYFTQFEDIDFRLRKEMIEMNKEWAPRKTPSADDYRKHQVKSKAITSSHPGGLYRQFFFEDYFPNIPSRERIPPGFVKDSKSWHGCPGAAFARTFETLASRAEIWPPDVRAELSDLVTLYADHERELRELESKLNITSTPKRRPHPLRRPSSASNDGSSETSHKALPDGPQRQAGPASKERAGRGAQGTGQGEKGDKQQRTKRAAIWGSEEEEEEMLSKYEDLDSESQAQIDSESHWAMRRSKRARKGLDWKWGPDTPAEWRVQWYRKVQDISRPDVPRLEHACTEQKGGRILTPLEELGRLEKGEVGIARISPPPSTT
ncbi:uncharacterized protein KY384_002895 [Bacidia gigantensis]|uniref:uncharacterized protein n=1 Tax=Bacidia gigantensis TaxID=2732470 RepID=UPI001D03971A|nr:uncharacterized protein KY384_002895 [Bacidia gigantensis]KAG8532410.1 hypothetical protein KY384_002895 [Bacidia gigantensis]